MYLFVEQTVDDEEEGALLGVQHDEQDLKEQVCLVETQNPGTAQYDELGHDLEQNQPAKEKRDLNEVDVSFTRSRQTFCLRPGVFGLGNTASHVGQGGSQRPERRTEQEPV